MSATDGLIELVNESIFNTLDTSGREPSEIVAERVVDHLKQATDTAGLVGYVVANGQVREIKEIESRYHSQSDDGDFVTWTLTTIDEETDR